MWFEEKRAIRAGGIRRKQRRGQTVSLNASLKANKGKGIRLSTVGIAGSAVAALLAAGVLLWYGAGMLIGALFSNNHLFAIRKVDIRGSAMITEDLIREYTQVREGMNLFQLNIEAMREDFLRRAPSVKSMEISRVLPDTLSMEITERIPLARFGWRGPLVVDRKGVLFVVNARSSHLPVITGYPGTGPRPGDRLSGMALAALEVLDVCDDCPGLGLEIEAIEVDNMEHLLLRLSDRKSARLAWEGMGGLSTASRDNLLQRLGELSVSMRSEEGLSRFTFDVPPQGPIYCR